ncbi:class I SAM-dependent methyltransferase [Salinarimonas chemoclinalis]|uniref:class I SAM-dependent methyltransferase n=1 Tax=Salinarimonas chemoclinalis TaxID=3241599 RepID=UPI0035565BAD
MSSALKQTYVRYVYPNKRLHHFLFPYAIFFKFLIDHIVRFPRQLLKVDLVRLLICVPRYLFYRYIMRYRREYGVDPSLVSEGTVAHNMAGLGEISAPRSHLLVAPLLSVYDVARRVGEMRVLSIGPRVEGELFNLRGYGFRKKNIEAIDLFSFSPLIDVGDMHKIEHPDASFDIVISGWVLGYSDDKALAVREMLRVLKPGGLLAIGNAYDNFVDPEWGDALDKPVGSRERITSLATIERLCDAQPDQIVFRSDGSADDTRGDPIILIMRKRS